jgi:large subunit ribosomal protein L1
MDKEMLDKLSAFVTENKGKRKFTQSVDLVVNFTGIDFTKPDNRINAAIKLPNGRGKTSDVILFSDDRTLAEKAQELGAKVVKSTDLPSLTSDKAAMASLLKAELLAQPALMPQIAKALGQFLGPRNKMPKPLIGTDLATAINNISKSIFIRSKGKYLPTAHCTVGNEKMETGQIAQNVDEVLGTFAKKPGKQYIKSVFIKFTMSKPVRLV